MICSYYVYWGCRSRVLNGGGNVYELLVEGETSEQTTQRGKCLEPQFLIKVMNLINGKISEQEELKKTRNI